MINDFQHNLEQYAALAVEVGVNMQLPAKRSSSRRRLFRRSVMRKVSETSLRSRRASYVHVEWNDDVVTGPGMNWRPANLSRSIRSMAGQRLGRDGEGQRGVS